MKRPDDRSHKHCIIGAGFSGLAVAAAFQRAGIAYDQLEADDQVGGNWYHGVYETAHIISSRKTTQYSDYPMPDHWPDFPSAEQMFEYLNAYADHWDLRPSIEFNCRVSNVRPLDNGLWRVDCSDGDKRVYGGVVVCNGHHWDMRWPDYPGRFDGEIIHSKQYKDPQILKGKRVLVVGGGNSGCDIAVEAARFSAESHISLRRGYWFMPKTMMGIPTVEFLKPWMLPAVQKTFVENALRAIVGPYSRYGLQEPTGRVFERHPTINSQLLYFLKHGTITPHRDIERLESGAVHFVDGDRLEIDLLVYATGFHVSIPFVDPGVIHWNNGFPDLVSGIFARRHRNFYVVGIGQPRYGAGPLLTAASETLAGFVGIQPRLKHPLGVVLNALGVGPMRNYLLDPHGSLRQTKLAQALAPRLPLVERWLERLGKLNRHLEQPPLSGASQRDHSIAV